MDATAHSYAYEYMQILSKAEERTLVRWITHLTSAEFPASPALAIGWRKKSAVTGSSFRRNTPSYLRPIGKNWLDRFKKRHPEVQGVWARKIEGAGHNAMNVETVKTWFEAVTKLCLQHQYTPDRICNMAQSSFAVGESQSSRALVNIRENSSWKVISGRQE